MLTDNGGSNARDRTSSIDDPSLTFMILIRKARSLKLKRIISGSGWSAIYTQARSGHIFHEKLLKPNFVVVPELGEQVETQS